MQTIEKHIIKVYTDMKKIWPNLNRVTFEAGDVPPDSFKVCGFYHLGDKCTSYDSIAELIDALSEINSSREL